MRVGSEGLWNVRENSLKHERLFEEEVNTQKKFFFLHTMRVAAKMKVYGGILSKYEHPEKRKYRNKRFRAREKLNRDNMKGHYCFSIVTPNMTILIEALGSASSPASSSAAAAASASKLRS